MDDFSIAAIFSDNMVLQRNRCVSFFGEAKGDFCVSVSIFDKKGDVLSQNKCFSQDGKWICRLETLTAQVAVASPYFAVIVALPSEKPKTRPLDETSAMLGLELSHWMFVES